VRCLQPSARAALIKPIPLVGTLANALTVARVILIFVVIAVWSRQRTVASLWLDIAMVPLLAWAIFMDALDGWAARRFNEESKAGALFDIAGDRVVELALWTFFAIRRDASGQPFVPYWVPILIITRTVLTDFVRSVAFGQGKTAFGSEGMQSARGARELTTSRWSRAAYGGLKAVTFCALGAALAWQDFKSTTETRMAVQWTIDILVYATVVFSILRAIPVVWEGRRFIAAIDKPG
jgi:CDP-diacylglycerol---glycerol-3-phosphate 3-phosphatidyltransferase